MRKTIRVQTVKCMTLAAFMLLGSVSAAAASWQDGVVIKGAKGSESSDVRIGQERYGPISTNDTLWDIARQYKPHSSVSQYQTMVAIVQANEKAFVNGNMNRMLDGFYLRIPSLQEIKMVNPEAARRQVVVDGQLKSKEKQLSDVEKETQQTRSEQQEILEQAREKAEQTVQAVEERQEKNFNELRSDIQQSMQTVERMYSENESLQQRIDTLAKRLDELAASVSKTDELEVQFQQVLAQQNQLLEQQAQREAEASSGFTDWLQSPLNMLMVSVLPALLIIGFIVFLFLRRSRPATDEAESPKEEPPELTEEQAAAELDKELLGDMPQDTEDGLFEIDGEDTNDDEGDDLSALEAELTARSESPEQSSETDFSVRLDDEEPDVETPVSSSPEMSDPIDEDDAAVLPDDTSEEESGELSQDELDRLFSEPEDDDSPAIDLSVDESETPDEPVEGQEQDQVQEHESTPEPETAEDSTADDNQESSEVIDADDIDALIAGHAPDDTDESDGDDLLPDDFDDSEVDDVLAELGLSEAEESEPSADDDSDVAEGAEETEPDEDDLDSLLQESDELTQSLDELDDLEEEVPEDDAELDSAETEADQELESLFGGSQNETDDNDFVDIDSLMAEADEEEQDSDRYESSAIQDVLPEGEQNPTDSAQDDEPAGQLDLARAYIEMGEEDEARDILQELVNGDDEALAKEAQALREKLDS